MKFNKINNSINKLLNYKNIINNLKSYFYFSNFYLIFDLILYF